MEYIQEQNGEYRIKIHFGGRKINVYVPRIVPETCPPNRDSPRGKYMHEFHYKENGKEEYPRIDSQRTNKRD